MAGRPKAAMGESTGRAADQVGSERLRALGDVQRHQPRDQDRDVEVADDRLQRGERLGRLHLRHDVAVAERRLGHEAERDQLRDRFLGSNVRVPKSSAAGSCNSASA
jgi:hypothetical protein